MADFGTGNTLIGADPVAMALESRGIGLPAPLLEQQSMASPTGPGVMPNAPTGGGAPPMDQMAQPLPPSQGLQGLEPATLTPQGVANAQGLIPPTNPEAEMILKAMQDRLKAITEIQKQVYVPSEQMAL